MADKEKTLRIRIPVKVDGNTATLKETATALGGIERQAEKTASAVGKVGASAKTIEVAAMLEILNKISSAVNVAVESVREYGKVNEEAARSAKSFDATTQDLHASFGKLVQDTGIIDALSLSMRGWSAVIQYWSGTDIAKIGAVGEAARLAALAAADGEQKLLDVYEKRYQWQLKIAAQEDYQAQGGAEADDLGRGVAAIVERLDQESKARREKYRQLALEEAAEKARIAEEAASQFALPGEQGGPMETGSLENIRRANEAKLDLLRQLEEGQAQVYEKIARDAEQAADREAAAAERAAAKIAAAAQKKNNAVDTSEKQQQELLSTTFSLMEQGAQTALSAALAHSSSAKQKAEAERQAAGIIAGIQAGLEAARAIQSYASQDYASGALHTLAAIAFAAQAKASFMAPGERGGGGGGGSSGGDSGSSTRARRDRSEEGGGGTSTTIIYQAQGNIYGDRHAARYQEQLRKLGRRSGMVTGGR